MLLPIIPKQHIRSLVRFGNRSIFRSLQNPLTPPILCFVRCQHTVIPKQYNINPTNKNIKNELKLLPNDSKASGFRDIKRLFYLAKPETKSMVIALLLILISSAVSMTVPTVIGKLLDISKQDNNESKDDQEPLIYGLTSTQFYSVLGGVFVVGAFANMGRIVILKVAGEKLVSRLRTRTLKAALQQDSTFLDHNRVGDLISRLSSDASLVSKSVTQNISDGIRAVIQGAVGFGMMSYISWKLTCVMMLLAPPLATMALVYGRRIRNLSRKLQTSVGDLTKVAEEQLSSTKTIQAYCGEQREIRRYANEVRNVFDIGLKEAMTSGVFFGMTGLVGNVALLALLLTGTSMIKTGLITVGDLSSFMMYAIYTGSSLFGLSSFYSELMKGAGAAARVFELNDRKPLIHPTRGKDPKSLLNKSIYFDKVSFAYPVRTEYQIFQDLSLTIRPGEHVCIVGPSGGGKSTIASLLLRYYDVNSGSIIIGNDNIQDFNLRKYRRLLSVVQQEPLLFNGTILDNITYAVPPEISRDEMRISKAIGQANCTKFLSNFPDGLKTIVGPRGAQLSGGQKQRVALARAFLLDPGILILDEATSALDSQSEEIVAKSLYSRTQRGLITISIAHRVSTIQHSSRVIVLNKHGGVAETGTFEELINNQHSDLNKLLSRAYQEEEEHQDVTLD